jgi:uncharacterized membrane protein YphA (DoxX/SURF4 family)
MDTTTAPASASAAPALKPRRRILPLIARLLLGLMFFVFGLNGFLNFIPPPSKPMPEGSMAFVTAMMNTGYLLQFVKGTEVVCGALLLLNLFVPLALVVLMPIILNIVAFHAFLAPSGVGFAIVILGLNLYLAWTYRAAYRPLLTARATPA